MKNVYGTETWRKTCEKFGEIMDGKMVAARK